MSGRSSLTRAEPGTGVAAPARRSRFRLPGRARIAGFLAGVLVAAAIGVLALWLPQRSSGASNGASGAAAPPQWQRPAMSASGLAERSGVRLIRVAVTGGGGLLDLRYQVVDPSKAVTVHEAQTPPAIIDERTGLVLNRLLMGHAHHGQLKPAVSYYLIFENTGNWVRRGSEVTVLLGDAQVEHVVVK
jgi:hypothetical protein